MTGNTSAAGNRKKLALLLTKKVNEKVWKVINEKADFCFLWRTALLSPDYTLFSTHCLVRAYRGDYNQCSYE